MALVEASGLEITGIKHMSRRKIGKTAAKTEENGALCALLGQATALTTRGATPVADATKSFVSPPTL
jgi:hypothetical protein